MINFFIRKINVAFKAKKNQNNNILIVLNKSNYNKCELRLS